MEILPVVKLLSCLFVHGFFVLIMFVVFLISGRLPQPSWLQLIYYAFAASMLALALSYFTCAIQVFFKDMAQIVSICLQFGMWLTPIMYSEQLFLDKGDHHCPDDLEAESVLLYCGRVPGQHADRRLVFSCGRR